MALNQYGLGIIFSAKDQASKTIQSLSGDIDRTSEAAQKLRDNFVKGGIEVAKGAALMAGGIRALKGMANLSKEYAEFNAVVASTAKIAGAGQEGFKKLEDAARMAGVKTIFAPREAAETLRGFAQAGFTVEQQTKSLLPALRLATASFDELGPQQAGGLVTVAMRAFGVQANETGFAVDQMVKASNSFKMSLADLPIGLAAVSRGSIALNQKLGESLVAFGLVKNAGLSTQRAATTLSVAMERLARPKVAKALGKQGIAVTDTAGRFLPFLDIVSNLTKVTNKMTQAKKAAYLQDLFGAEAAGALLPIMKQLREGIKVAGVQEPLKGAAAVEHLRNKMAGAKGEAAAMADAFEKTLQGQITLLRGSLQTLRIEVGSIFAKGFKPAVSIAKDALNGLLVLLKGMPEPLKSVIGFTGGILAMAVAVAGLVKAVAGLGLMMKAAAAAKAFAVGGQAAAAAAMKASVATMAWAQATAWLRANWGMLVAGGILLGAAVAIGAVHARVEKIRKEIKTLHKNVDIIREAYERMEEKARGGNKAIADMARNIRTQAQAQKAMIKANQMLEASREKIMKLQIKMLRAEDDGNVKRKVQLQARLLEEKGVFRGILKQRESLIVRGTEFELGKTKKNTAERLRMLKIVTAATDQRLQMALAARRQYVDKEGKSIAGASDFEKKLYKRQLARQDQQIAGLRKRRTTLTKETEKERRRLGAAAAPVITSGREMITRPGAIEERRMQVALQAQRLAFTRRAGPTGPTTRQISFGEKVEEFFVSGISGMRAREAAGKPEVRRAQHEAKLRTMQRELNNSMNELKKLIKLQTEQPSTTIINVKVGDDVITKSVKRGERAGAEESGGLSAYVRGLTGAGAGG